MLQINAQLLCINLNDNNKQNCNKQWFNPFPFTILFYFSNNSKMALQKPSKHLILFTHNKHLLHVARARWKSVNSLSLLNSVSA